jgi:hypothetical protein
MLGSKQRQRWIARGTASSWLALHACTAQPTPRAPEPAPALVETATEASASPPPATAPSTPGVAPRTSTSPTRAAAASAAPTLSPPATDTSLSPSVYRAAGVPEVDHAWTVADYQRCLEVFVELLRSGRSDLPRAQSPRSGALFTRLVDARNFDDAPGVPAGERARRLSSYLEVFPGFLKVYAPANDGIDFSVEQAELIVGLLELLKSALASSRDFTARDASWMKDYERQKAITLGVVRGVGTMLSEPERYAEPVRRHLEAELARLAPELETHLTPDAAREVRNIALVFE